MFTLSSLRRQQLVITGLIAGAVASKINQHDGDMPSHWCPACVFYPTKEIDQAENTVDKQHARWSKTFREISACPGTVNQNTLRDVKYLKEMVNERRFHCSGCLVKLEDKCECKVELVDSSSYMYLRTDWCKEYRVPSHWCPACIFWPQPLSETMTLTADEQHQKRHEQCPLVKARMSCPTNEKNVHQMRGLKWDCEFHCTTCLTRTHGTSCPSHTKMKLSIAWCKANPAELTAAKRNFLNGWKSRKPETRQRRRLPSKQMEDRLRRAGLI